ncbi:MAG: copper resistance protein CopC [Chloroflexota bacterium]
MRGNYRFLFILSLLVAVWSATAVSVQAHARLLEADPAPGSTLDAPPTEIRLTFNEPIGTDSRIGLFNNAFYAQTGVESFVDLQNPNQLVATLPPLNHGIYNVNWTAVSTDGHPVSGSFRFQIGETEANLGEGTNGNEWFLPFFVGGLLLFGVVFVIGRKRASDLPGKA